MGVTTRQGQVCRRGTRSIKAIRCDVLSACLPQVARFDLASGLIRPVICHLSMIEIDLNDSPGRTSTMQGATQ
jgi:hypothetical protein